MRNFNDAKILIVDDAPGNVEILGDILHDYKRSVAINGEKALKIAFSANPPDIILLDIMMPGMDGFEVCRRLKENPATREIPVIFITGKTDVEDETKGLTLGAVDFIPKPISAPVVLARVRNHIELSLSKKLLGEQKNQLELQNKFMTDSINYAKRIQTAILPGEQILKTLFPDSFLIFQPKDIVSGDFYWVGQLDGKILLAVVDCTGHGVPGAFMSMIGNTLLNEIVNINKLTNPSEILQVLDEGIIHELNKDVNDGTLDGMDIALCVFDSQAQQITFSSAYRPLLYIQNNELFEIKGDTKSIGDNRKKIIYTSHAIPWAAGMCIYMMSDGFADQNNDENSKFGAKQIKGALLQVCGQPMEGQKRSLLQLFDEHKKDEPQRDDVTFIGLRI